MNIMPEEVQKQSQRTIDDIIIHCAATPPTMDIGAREIRHWHISGNGWADIGYHYVIRRNGIVEKGRSDDVVGAHVKGHNARTLGICLVGGIDERKNAENNFTPEQKTTLLELVTALRALYPKAGLHGHSDYANKACPCFDVALWWAGEKHDG